MVKSIIKEKGRHKVIDKISVALNDKAGTYEASFSNLGITKVLVAANTVKKYPKLLVSGVWCIAALASLKIKEISSNSLISLLEKYFYH